MSEYPKPVPVPSEDSRPFWNAAKKHQICLQQCPACKSFRFPPAPVCPECTALGGDWMKLKGTGKIFSFVIYHRAFHKAFERELPYAVAVIELDEGPRLISNIVDIVPDRIRCDTRVEAVFEDITPDCSLLKFRPAP